MLLHSPKVGTNYWNRSSGTLFPITTSDKLNIDGAVTFSSTIGVSGLGTFSSNVDILGNLDITSGITATTGTFSSGIQANNGVFTSGITATTGNFSSSVDILGNLDVSSGITATTGNFSSGINVTGASTFSSSVGITGKLTLSTDAYGPNLNYNEGILSDATITASTGTNLSVTSVDVLIRSDSSWGVDEKLYRKTVPATTGLAVVPGVNYLYATWNGGSPIYGATTDRDVINNSNIIPVSRVYMETTGIEYQLDYDYVGKGASIRNFERVMRLRGNMGIERESGLTITTGGALDVNLSSGFVWFGLSRKSIDTFAQTVDESHLWYQTATGWASSSIVTYNNTYYNSSTGLATLTANRYAVNWIYRNIDSVKEMDIVLSTGDYTLAQAEASPEPQLPPQVRNFYTLCGRILIQKASTSAYAIENVTNTAFETAGVTDHGSLTGLSDDDHTQYALLANTRGDQTFAGNINFTSGIDVTGPIIGSTGLSATTGNFSSGIQVLGAGTITGLATLSSNATVAGNLGVSSGINVIGWSTFSSSISIGSTGATTSRVMITGGDNLLTLDTTSVTGNPYFNFSQGGTRRSYIQHIDGGDQLGLVSEYGAVSFWTDDAGSEAVRMVVDSSGYVGIGTTSPDAFLDVVGSSSHDTLSITGSDLTGTYADVHIYKQNYYSFFMQDVASSGSAGQCPVNLYRRSRGTIAAPTAVLDGDQIGGFFMRGYDGGQFRQCAGMSAFVSGSVTTDSVPMDLYFYTGSSAGALNRMKISSIGNVSIGSTSDTYKLEVNGGEYITSSLVIGSTANITSGLYAGGPSRFATGLAISSVSPTTASMLTIDVVTNGQQNMYLRQFSTNSGYGPIFRMLKYPGGTSGSTAAALTDMYCGEMIYQGVSAGTAYNVGDIAVVSEGGTSGTTLPGRFEFWLAQSGAFSPKMILGSSGCLIIGSTSTPTAKLDVNGNGLFSSSLSIGSLTTGALLYLSDGGKMGISGFDIQCDDQNPYAMRITQSSASKSVGMWIDSNARYHIYDISAGAYRHTISSGGNHGLSNSAPSYLLTVGTTAAGSSGTTDIWAQNTISAIAYIDRTPYPKDKEQAYNAVLSMKLSSDGKLDHSKLDKFVQADEGSRDLSATVSAQNAVLQDLINRIKLLEDK